MGVRRRISANVELYDSRVYTRSGGGRRKDSRWLKPRHPAITSRFPHPHQAPTVPSRGAPGPTLAEIRRKMVRLRSVFLAHAACVNETPLAPTLFNGHDGAKGAADVKPRFASTHRCGMMSQVFGLSRERAPLFMSVVKVLHCMHARMNRGILKDEKTFFYPPQHRVATCTSMREGIRATMSDSAGSDGAINTVQ